MKSSVKILVAALMLGGTALAVATPAEARVGLSIGIGVPGPYWGYRYDRPCWFYRAHALPAPARCYDYYRAHWGSGVYLDGNFVFGSRDAWYHWRDRDDYRHWRDHWHGHDGGHDHGGWHDHH